MHVIKQVILNLVLVSRLRALAHNTVRPCSHIRLQFTMLLVGSSSTGFAVFLFYTAYTPVRDDSQRDVLHRGRRMTGSFSVNTPAIVSSWGYVIVVRPTLFSYVTLFETEVRLLLASTLVAGRNDPPVLNLLAAGQKRSCIGLALKADWSPMGNVRWLRCRVLRSGLRSSSG